MEKINRVFLIFLLTFLLSACTAAAEIPSYITPETSVTEEPETEPQTAAPKKNTGPATAEITIDDFEGKASISIGDEDTAAIEGRALFQDNSVVTSAKSWSCLKITEERYILIEENSEIQITRLSEAETGAELYLKNGKIWVAMKNMLPDPENLIIQTPSCSLETRGMVFSVEAAENFTRAAVYDGSVALSAQNETAVNITNGAAEITVINGAAETTKTKLDEKDLQPFYIDGPDGAGGIYKKLREILVGLFLEGKPPSMQIIAAAAGTRHSLVVKIDGSLWAFGFNDYGQLGDGSKISKSAPVKIMDDVVAVSAGSGHSLALKKDGTLWSWGENTFGQLGNGTATVWVEIENKTEEPKTEEKKIEENENENENEEDAEKTEELEKTEEPEPEWDGIYKIEGYLVDNDKLRPIKIMNDVLAISAGSSHNLALKTDGSLWAWGRNDAGEVGDGSTTDRLSPVKIMTDVAAVSAGSGHSLAIKTDGSLWAWGLNDCGQLGDGTGGSYSSEEERTDKSAPVKIMDDVIAVSAGNGHSLAITKYGSLFAWGWNNNGQLGDGSTDSKHTPVKVMDGVVAAGAGSGYSLAITRNGYLWAWGLNDCGQLGDGDSDTKLMPVMEIMGEAAAVSAGWNHNFAITKDGGLWAWGHNEIGELGDGTNENKLTPVKIME